MGGQRGVVDEILTIGVLVKIGRQRGHVVGALRGEGGEGGQCRGLRTAHPGRAYGQTQGLIDSLKTWRFGQARAQGVPAYVMFNDRTLEALAALRPGTEEALLESPASGPPSSRPMATSSSTCWAASKAESRPEAPTEIAVLRLLSTSPPSSSVPRPSCHSQPPDSSRGNSFPTKGCASRPRR